MFIAEGQTERGFIIIDFSKAFNLIPHDRLLTQLASSFVDSGIVVCVRDFLDLSQCVRGGQLSKEVKLPSGFPQGSVFIPLLFVVYVNDIWRNIETSNFTYSLTTVQHWTTKFKFFFVPRTSIDELSSTFCAEFRNVYRIFHQAAFKKSKGLYLCKIVLYVLIKQAETYF